MRVANCWAHAQRKLKEAFDLDGSEIAAERLRRTAEFHAIEPKIRNFRCKVEVSHVPVDHAGLVCGRGTGDLERTRVEPH